MNTDVEPRVTEAQVARRRSTCRACCSAQLEPVLSLGTQYLPRFPQQEDRDLPRAPLELVRCAMCSLLQLAHTVDPELLFREFHYRSGINEVMRAALEDIVADGVRYHSDGGWLDIGANDGYLLSQVPEGFTRVACEPALNFRDELRALGCEVISNYFTALDCVGSYEVITSAACFYDVDTPDNFVADIAAVLAPDGVWINQLNDAPTMLKRNALDSICHEHLCYYDVPTLKALYARHGLTITNVSHNEVNGGSIRVTARRKSWGDREANLSGLGACTRAEVTAFADRALRWKQRLKDVLKMVRSHGEIWGYGASTKGAVLLQYLDLPPGILTAIADRNPLKHGTRMVGNWLPIVSEEAMRRAAPEALLCLPWTFEAQMREREAETIASGTTFIAPLPEIRLWV